jgi:hypothetical protein
MALLWIEGFEGFGSTAGLPPQPSGIMGRKYPSIIGENNFDMEVGRNGWCLENGDSIAYFQTPFFTTTDATLVCGLAFWCSGLPGSFPSNIIAFYEGANNGINIRVNTSGTLAAYRSTSLLGTSSLSIGAGQWYYIELKVLTNNSTGTVEIKVNGATWLNLTSQDTQQGSNAWHDAVRIGTVNCVSRFDDMYVLDSSGSANNDFLGNRKVVALDPDGAGDTTAWTPSAGSNYQNVDEGDLLDEDTTYNETSTDTDQDLYTYENLPANAASVDGIQITSEARVTSGQMDLSNVIKTGTTTDAGSADTITSTSYVTSTRIEEQDPDTAAPWTPSGVDGAQFGIRANT